MSTDRHWAVAVCGYKGSFFFGVTDTLHAIYIKQAKDYNTVIKMAEKDFLKSNPEFKVSSSVATIINFEFTLGGVPVATDPKTKT